jgi:hypothetical protein
LAEIRRRVTTDRVWGYSCDVCGTEYEGDCGRLIDDIYGQFNLVDLCEKCTGQVVGYLKTLGFKPTWENDGDYL